MCKLLVGGSANRSLTVAAPAGGSRLFRSCAGEQAVSSKILFGFLKEEVFHRPVSERSRGEAATTTSWNGPAARTGQSRARQGAGPSDGFFSAAEAAPN